MEMGEKGVKTISACRELTYLYKCRFESPEFLSANKTLRIRCHAYYSVEVGTRLLAGLMGQGREKDLGDFLVTPTLFLIQSRGEKKQHKIIIEGADFSPETILGPIA